MYSPSRMAMGWSYWNISVTSSLMVESTVRISLSSTGFISTYQPLPLARVETVEKSSLRR